METGETREQVFGDKGARSDALMLEQQADADRERVLAYHRKQHTDCVTCRLMAERDEEGCRVAELRQAVLGVLPDLARMSSGLNGGSVSLAEARVLLAGAIAALGAAVRKGGAAPPKEPDSAGINIADMDRYPG